MNLHRLNPVIYAVMTAALFGSGSPIAKVLLQGIPPMSLAAFLYFGSGIGLLAYLLTGALSGSKRVLWEASLQKSDIPWLIGVIICGGCFAPLLLMVSLQVTHAATAAMLLNFEAVATTTIAALIFKEAVGKRVWVALTLITIACILLSWDPNALLGLSLPALGILIVCVFWSLDNNFARNISSKDPVLIVAIKGLCGGTLSLTAALLLGEALPSPIASLPAFVLGFVSYGGLTSVLFILALRGLGTSRSASFLAISPLFGVTVALLLFSNLPSAGFIFAVPIMAVGVSMLLTEKHTHYHRHPEVVHEHRHRHDDMHHSHEHAPGMPPISESGEHSHPHIHPEIIHDHLHKPDIHHRHSHEK